MKNGRYALKQDTRKACLEIYTCIRKNSDVLVFKPNIRIENNNKKRRNTNTQLENGRKIRKLGNWNAITHTSYMIGGERQIKKAKKARWKYAKANIMGKTRPAGRE